MTYIFLLILTTFYGIRTVLDKYFQQSFENGIKSAAVYNFINAIYGTICFFIMGGFSFDMNTKTLIFSIVYAICVAVNHISIIYAMSSVSVALTGLTYTAGSMLIPGLFGVFSLDESINSKFVIAVILMLLSVILPYFAMAKKRLTFKDIIICGIYFINSGILIIISKLYAITDGVCSSTSFYCMTNIVIAVVSFIVTIIYCIIKRESFPRVMRTFNFRQNLNILSRNLLADIGAVITIIILTTMDVSLYTVATSSLYLICAAVVSRLYFKEQFSKSNLVSVLLAIFALVLCM